MTDHLIRKITHKESDHQLSPITNQTMSSASITSLFFLLLGVVSTMAAQTTQIETSSRFCALTSDGGVVDTGRVEAMSEPNSDWSFSYKDHQVLAFAHEVSSFIMCFIFWPCQRVKSLTPMPQCSFDPHRSAANTTENTCSSISVPANPWNSTNMELN